MHAIVVFVRCCYIKIDEDLSRVPEPLYHLNAREFSKIQIRVYVSVKNDSIFEIEEVPTEILPFLKKEVKGSIKLILIPNNNLMIGEHAGSRVEVDFKVLTWNICHL